MSANQGGQRYPRRLRDIPDGSDWGSATASLLGRDHANDPSTVLLWPCFHFAKLTKSLDHHFHDLVPLFDVSHFTATEQDTHLDLVLVLKELLSLTKFGADIFLTSFRSKSNLQIAVSVPA